MLQSTRRRFLYAIASGSAIAMSGCTAGIGTSVDADEGPDRHWDEESIITEFDASHHRFEDVYDPEAPLVYYDDSGDDAGGRRRHRLPYVIDTDDVDQLEFRTSPTDLDAVMAFFDATDFDEETVLVSENPVSECHRWEVQYVEIRSSDRLAPQFCQVKRDPMTACTTDVEQTQVSLIRVGRAYESPPSGHGRGRSSSCRLPPEHPAHRGVTGE